MKIGIAFAGGGARGAAHLGVLQALEENNIVADYYAGASAGSIIATMKALGKSNEECLDMIKESSSKLIDISYWDILKSLPSKFSTLDGLAKGNEMKKWLSKHIGDTSFLRNVKKDLTVVSTDINTGSQVIFSSVDFSKKDLRRIDDQVKFYDRYTPLNLPNLVYASSSISGVFQPITYNNMKLVDGGVTNNMPSDLVKLMGADKVIAINMNERNPSSPTVNGILDIVWQSISTMIMQNEFLSLSQSEDTIFVDVETPIGVMDFNRAMEAYQAGYDCGISMIDEIKQKLGS